METAQKESSGSKSVSVISEHFCLEADCLPCLTLTAAKYSKSDFFFKFFFKLKKFFLVQIFFCGVVLRKYMEGIIRRPDGIFNSRPIQMFSNL